MADSTAGRAGRAWEWYLSDAGRRLFVGAVWAALVGTAFGYVAQYTRNWPIADEWAFVGDFLAGDKPRGEWIFERHAEHRYPFARSILVLIDEVCGHDYRIATGLNAVLLAAASAFLILAARRLRGTTEYTDCFFPALLLHRGHCEELLMGYQLAFALSEFCIAAFVLALAGSRPRLGIAALAVAGLAGGGGAGILFALPLGLTLLAIIVRRRTGFGPACLTAIALAAAALQIADALLHPTDSARNGFAVTATVTLQVADGAFGRCIGEEFPGTGAAVIAGALLAALLLVRSARRDPVAHRSLALLAVLAGAFAFLLAVGHARPNGYAYRNSAFSQFAVAVPWLWATRFRERRRWHAVVGAAIVAVVATQVIRQNWGSGIQCGDRYAEAYAAAEGDARRGIPVDALAERNHYYFQSAEWNARAWRILHTRGIGLAAEAPPRPILSVAATAPLAQSADSLRWPIGTPVPGVRAVRVRGTRPTSTEWTSVRFTWIEVADDGRETSRSERRAVWRNPGAWSALLWIDGSIREVTLECDGEDRPESVEWLR